jgi:hypothetical protein
MGASQQNIPAFQRSHALVRNDVDARWSPSTEADGAGRCVRCRRNGEDEYRQVLDGMHALGEWCSEWNTGNANGSVVAFLHNFADTHFCCRWSCHGRTGRGGEVRMCTKQ